MDSTVQEWNVDYVGFGGLEDWLNEANEDGWVLHTLERSGETREGDYRFFVVMYKPTNAKQRAAQKWALTVGTTGGHANE
jgi:hypothetical protein